MTCLLNTIREGLIGAKRGMTTPFGTKPLVYADYTASGRGLHFIEDYVRDTVLPWYANTHTTSSATGAQTTAFREQARAEIAKAVNAGDNDAVIFCGSGATAAVDKLIRLLALDQPSETSEPPVVFLGPYEHHSNELPWRESAAEVVRIALNDSGELCLDDLQSKLQQFNNRPLKIGSFSAASNVTGLKTDIEAVSRLLAEYDTLCCWDYAAGAPYLPIDMNSATPLDAVYISPHKFVGGPGTPGILVVKKRLFRRATPSTPGGGTVSWVSPNSHRYLPACAEREEGGTPGIVEAVRAGLVFKLQQQVGLEVITQQEHDYAVRALSFLRSCPNIEVLGPSDGDRMALFSLRFKHDDKDLHYGFITALMNDLFGIQVRGGCSCAGPYGHHLLGLTPDLSRAIENACAEGNMVLRPGWVRLNFNYFIDEEEFTYLLDAIAQVAEHGWRLLPYYQFDTVSNTWRYQGQARKTLNLDALDFRDIHTESHTPAPSYNDTFRAATRLLQNGPKDALKTYAVKIKSEHQNLCWFRLPQDVLPLLAKSA